MNLVISIDVNLGHNISVMMEPVSMWTNDWIVVVMLSASGYKSMSEIARAEKIEGQTNAYHNPQYADCVAQTNHTVMRLVVFIQVPFKRTKKLT